MNNKRFEIVNNYYRGLCVVDKDISSIIRDDFMDNIIENDCCPYNLVRIANELNSKNKELIDSLEKEIMKCDELRKEINQLRIDNLRLKEKL